jgi:hypothetical protein
MRVEPPDRGANHTDHSAKRRSVDKVRTATGAEERVPLGTSNRPDQPHGRNERGGANETLGRPAEAGSNLIVPGPATSTLIANEAARRVPGGHPCGKGIFGYRAKAAVANIPIVGVAASAEYDGSVSDDDLPARIARHIDGRRSRLGQSCPSIQYKVKREGVAEHHSLLGGTCASE